MPVPGNSVDNLPTVFYINQLKDIYSIMKQVEDESSGTFCQNCSGAKAIAFCQSCPETGLFICSSCVSAHKEMKAFSSHSVVLLADIKQGTPVDLPVKQMPSFSCPKHDGELMKLYCSTCNQLICRDCTLVDHSKESGHKYDFVTSIVSSLREEVLANLSPLQEMSAKTSQAITGVKTVKSEVADQATRAMQAITDSFDALQKILEEHKQELLKQVRELKERKLGTLESQQENLHLAQAKLISLIRCVEKTTKHASNEEFLSMKPNIATRIHDLALEYKELTLSPREEANMAVTTLCQSDLTELCKKNSSLILIELSGKEPVTSKLAKIQMKLNDSMGQPCTISATVTAEIKSLVDTSTVVSATVSKKGPSTFDISYTPHARGYHELVVQVNSAVIITHQVFVHHPPTLLGTPMKAIEGLETPCRLAIDNKGNFYVTEFALCQYSKFNCNLERTMTSDGGAFSESSGPRGIAADAEGQVYITSSHRLQKFGANGKAIKSIGCGNAGGDLGEFNEPDGLKLHNNFLYVCDVGNNRIQVFDRDLKYVKVLTSAHFLHPHDIGFDADGNMYIADNTEGRIVVLDPTGKFLHQIGRIGKGKGELNCPWGVCISGENVYVTEGYNHRMSVFTTSGSLVCTFGSQGSQLKQLQYPIGVVIDRHGFCFVCDFINNRIVVY